MDGGRLDRRSSKTFREYSSEVFVKGFVLDSLRAWVWQAVLSTVPVYFACGQF
jgi:hypothetical protein